MTDQLITDLQAALLAHTTRKQHPLREAEQQWLENFRGLSAEAERHGKDLERRRQMRATIAAALTDLQQNYREPKRLTNGARQILSNHGDNFDAAIVATIEIVQELNADIKARADANRNLNRQIAIWEERCADIDNYGVRSDGSKLRAAIQRGLNADKTLKAIMQQIGKPLYATNLVSYQLAYHLEYQGTQNLAGNLIYNPATNHWSLKSENPKTTIGNAKELEVVAAVDAWRSNLLNPKT